MGGAIRVIIDQSGRDSLERKKIDPWPAFTPVSLDYFLIEENYRLI
jgi:hypothetical protein